MQRLTELANETWLFKLQGNPANACAKAKRRVAQDYAPGYRDLRASRKRVDDEKHYVVVADVRGESL
jgi:hypothetical protein